MSSVSCAAFPPPRPSSHPVDVGLRSEAAIIQALVDRGYAVLLPWGTNQRYDLVIDFGDRFARVQCKTGRLRRGSVEFNTNSVRVNSRRAFRRPYDGEVEYFAVYCPDNEGVYVMPIEEIARGKGHLRVVPAANNQAKRIRWASDYELPPLARPSGADLESSDPPE